jgi:hypothetical protein
MQAPRYTNEEDLDALRSYIVRKLTFHEDADDIIYDICQHTGWDWARSKAFVEQVESENRPELSVWQGWLYLVIGGLTALAGLVLVGSVLLIVFGYRPLIQYLIHLPGLVALLDELAFASGIPINLLVYAGLSGLMMLVGGGLGILQGLKKIAA